MTQATLYCGDCLDVMAMLDENSADTVITDPPYGLKFMGREWDHGVPGVVFWKAALRVAKPGAMLLAFGGTRTHHRLMCAIEDAGWVIRDCLMWLYGSGFPKSHNISKAIDKAAGKLGIQSQGANYAGGDYEPREKKFRSDYGYKYHPTTEAAKLWDGWGTGLKPAWEPIILAMKPRDGTFAHNALKWGVAGLWIDGGRIPTKDKLQKLHGSFSFSGSGGANEVGKHIEFVDAGLGRWPANLILDEEAGALLDEQVGDAKARYFYCPKANENERNEGLDGMEKRQGFEKNTSKLIRRADPDTGKVGWSEYHPSAHQNYHPTVKPIALMEYLCKLTKTPTGGTVLDPFMGSGTTGIACIHTDRDFIGIEIEEEYFEIADARIIHACEES